MVHFRSVAYFYLAARQEDKIIGKQTDWAKQETGVDNQTWGKTRREKQIDSQTEKQIERKDRKTGRLKKE